MDSLPKHYHDFCENTLILIQFVFRTIFTALIVILKSIEHLLFLGFSGDILCKKTTAGSQHGSKIQATTLIFLNYLNLIDRKITSIIHC